MVALWLALFPAAGAAQGASPAPSRAWEAPIGIPAPSFGVNELAPSRPRPWTSAVQGYYYVDTTGTYGACSDRNGNGYPAAGKARCTVPRTLGPGSLVEVHGNQAYTLAFSWKGNGKPWTANREGPVWVRGTDYASRPKITSPWYTDSSIYVIMENLNFGAASSTSREWGLGLGDGEDNHHLVLRDSEISGGNTDLSITRNGGALGIGNWGYNSGRNQVHDIVIDNVNFHDVGPLDSKEDVDWHCIVVNGIANNVWVTHNSFARCGGDSMQIEAQQAHKSNIHHIYFGRNTSTRNRQSGGWIKNAQDVIFSQNSADSFSPNSGGPGTCYGAQYDHDYIWFLFNTCHDSTIGFDLASDNGAADNVYLIGNQLWHIVAAKFHPYATGAFIIRSAAHTYVVNNSVYDYIAGISAPPGAAAIQIENNIFQHRNSSSGYDLYQEGRGVITWRNNIFYNDGAAPATTLNWATCQRCMNRNPLFMSTATRDLRLQTAPRLSPAVDTGIVSGVYAAFQNRYGIDIRKDLGGNVRPLGSAWDIGAHEAK